jgi:hypothetical protein
MKTPNWEENFPSHFHVAIQPLQLQPGCTGRAIYKNVTVYLQIRKNENNILFHAVVTGFDPQTAKLPDLQVTDEVLVGIQHFIPD